jgi:hypothetical protein
MKTYSELTEGLFSDNIIVSPPKADIERVKDFLSDWKEDVEWKGKSFEIDEDDWNDLKKQLSYMSGNPKWNWHKNPSLWKVETV